MGAYRAVRRFRDRFSALRRASSSLSLICLLLCLCSCMAVSAESRPTGETNGGDSLLGTLKLAIGTNNDRLGGLRATLTQVTADRRVKERTVNRQELPNGGVIESIQEPSRVIRIQLAVAGESVRADYLDDGGAVSRTLAYDGELWTEARISSATDAPRPALLVRRTDQMPGIYPVDPRLMAGFDIRFPLPGLLSNPGATVSALQVAGQPLFRAELGIDPRQRFTVDFASSVDLLPTASTLYHSDGSILRRVDIAYERVLARNACFPKEIRTKFYEAGRATSPESTQYYLEETVTITDLQLFTPLDGANAVKVAVPPHARLHDFYKLTEDELRRLDQKEEPARPRYMYWFRLLSLLSVVLVGLVALRLTAQRLRRSSSNGGASHASKC
jgi:hypothetical protein